MRQPHIQVNHCWNDSKKKAHRTVCATELLVEHHTEAREWERKMPTAKEHYSLILIIRDSEAKWIDAF